MAAVLSPRRAYDLWADTYPATAHNPLMAAEEAVVSRAIAHIRARRALDVGTGSGRYLPLLAATGARTVGIDLSMAMLRRGTAPRRLCGDACDLPFRPAVFDLVNASLMVGDVRDLETWTREMARVLRSDGHLIYSDFHPTWSERGWQRTFRDRDGVLHAVGFEPHTIEQHLAALDAAGLRVLAIREPRLEIDRVRTAVVVVFHAIKDAIRP